jgi:hypothetical protein
MNEAKETFETQMAAKKSQWESNQAEHDLAVADRNAQSQKARKREEEEYVYNRELTRKKEQNDYDSRKGAQEKELAEKKAVVEKDLAERQKSVVEREQALTDLKKQVDEFPKKLELELQSREKSVLERIEFKYKHISELANREMDGERKLYLQKVSALDEKIKAQAEQIRELTVKSHEASLQVQGIAVKAIEGAAASTYHQQRFNEQLVANRHDPKAN